MRRAGWLLGGGLLGAAALGCLFASGPSTVRGEALPRSVHDSRVGRISALIGGERGAPRAIFVHGTPGSAAAWQAYVRDPPPGWEVFAIDRPGFGETRPAHYRPALADQAAALEPLLASAGGRWPVLIGHSLGGAVIVRAALDFPGRVSGLVVLAGALDPALERVHWYNWLARPFEALLPRALRNANRELRPFRAELEELRTRLAEVRCPVVIVHGERDRLVPFANAHYLREHLPNAEWVERVPIREGGHFIPWEHSEVARSALERHRQP